MNIIVKMKKAMDDVVGKLLEEEGKSDADLESKEACLWSLLHENIGDCNKSSIRPVMTKIKCK